VAAATSTGWTIIHFSLARAGLLKDNDPEYPRFLTATMATTVSPGISGGLHAIRFPGLRHIDHIHGDDDRRKLSSSSSERR